MFINHYVDPVFIAYLSRYLSGINKLKSKISKIHVSFELAESFGREALRFSIGIDFYDYYSLTDQEVSDTNRYFHDSINESGNQFVSFVYKDSRGDRDIQIDEIRSFIFHYSFAGSLIEDFIRKEIPKTCTLEVESLKKDPFFNYVDKFLMYENWNRTDERRSFEKQYYKFFHRQFEFDCRYHKALLDLASKHSSMSDDELISDKEIFTNGGGDMSDLRMFIMENSIPFNLRRSTDVIDEIFINCSVLIEKLQSYKPSYSYSRIDVGVILKILKGKQQKVNSTNEQKQALSEKYSLSIGNLIFVEKDDWGTTCNDIGIIRKIMNNYSDEFEVTYHQLNNDLQESKRPAKNVKLSGVKYVLTKSEFDQGVQSGEIKIKRDLLRLFNQKTPINSIEPRKRKK